MDLAQLLSYGYPSHVAGSMPVLQLGPYVSGPSPLEISIGFLAAGVIYSRTPDPKSVRAGWTMALLAPMLAGLLFGSLLYRLLSPLILVLWLVVATDPIGVARRLAN